MNRKTKIQIDLALSYLADLRNRFKDLDALKDEKRNADGYGFTAWSKAHSMDDDARMAIEALVKAVK